MPRVIAQRIGVTRPAMHTRCAWLGISASDIRPEHRCHGPATHTCCASHLSAEMAEMLEVTALRTACTLPSAEYGGVVRKGCHLRGRQPIIGNPPTRLGSCRNR